MLTTEFRLKVFCSVAKHASYTKAAQEMLISQPAVTRHIQELESIYNKRLFNRMGNSISLTSAGKILLEHSEKILKDYDYLNFEMNLLNGKHSGELRIGASTTISQYVLPPMLANFISKFPDIHVKMFNANSEKIEEALLNHSIDVGLVECFNRNSNLHYIPFMDDELVAVTSVKSTLHLHDELTIEELKKIPLVLRENGSGTLSVFQHALKQLDKKLSDFNVLVQLGSSESIKLFLQNASCIGILSYRCVTKEIMNGVLRVIELPELEMQRPFTFILPQGEDGGLPSIFTQFMLHEQNYKG